MYGCEGEKVRVELIQTQKGSVFSSQTDAWRMADINNKVSKECTIQKLQSRDLGKALSVNTRDVSAPHLHTKKNKKNKRTQFQTCEFPHTNPASQFTLSQQAHLNLPSHLDRWSF